MLKELETLFSALAATIKTRIEGVEADIASLRGDVEALKVELGAWTSADLGGFRTAIDGLRSGAAASAAAPVAAAAATDPAIHPTAAAS